MPRHALPATRQHDRNATIGVLVILLFCSSFVLGTTATFSASTSNPDNRFAMAALDPPTNLGGEMAGTGASLAWLAASGPSNAGAGYNISWADAGAPSVTGAAPSCPSIGTFTTIGDTAGAAYTDSTADTRAEDPPGTPRPGRYVCYSAATVYPYPVSATPWTSQGVNPVTRVQVGFVASTVAISSSAAGNNLEAGDSITISFNQPVAVSSGPAEGTTPATGTAPRVCVRQNNGQERIVLGGVTAHNAACLSSEVGTVGVLTDVVGNNRINAGARFTTTWSWTDCPQVGIACRKLTATLGARTAGNLPNVTNNDPWLFTPASTLLSATGSVALCTANPTGGLCLPRTTGAW